MSPWVFYVIDVVHSLRIVMIITAVMSTFGWFFILPSCVENESPMFDKLDFLLIFLWQVLLPPFLRSFFRAVKQ